MAVSSSEAAILHFASCTASTGNFHRTILILPDKHSSSGRHHRNSSSGKRQDDSHRQIFSSIAALLFAAAFALPPHASAQPGYGGQQRITCSSNDGRRNWCAIGNSRDVQLVRQISGSPCVRGQTWGVDNRGLWVDHGCRADFAFSTGYAPGPRRANDQLLLKQRQTKLVRPRPRRTTRTVRSAVHHACAARPGASTIRVSGSTMAAALTSRSSRRLRPYRPAHLHRRSSPAPPTTANETGVTPVVVAIFALTGRSAAHPAFRARPGASTTAASGSTMAAAQSFASANPHNKRRPLPRVASVSLSNPSNLRRKIR